MPEEIVNRVAKSKLQTFNLEKLYLEGERLSFDLKDWLYEEMILREKDFRKYVQEHDWEQYKGKFVALTCSVDAIVPIWAYMLVTSRLQPYAGKVIKGDLSQLEASLYQSTIENLDLEAYRDLPVIVKGCSDTFVPEDAYLQLVQRLQPVAKSLMFGEACSSVPIYKRPRKKN